MPADPADDGWQLNVQPSLADWCAAYAVVAASHLDDDLPGVDAEVVRFERVARESPLEVLRWGMQLESEADVRRVWDTITVPVFRLFVSVGDGAVPHALTFAAPPVLVNPLRRALRPLERDGLLVPRALFHAGEDEDLGIPDPRCPHCEATRTAP